MWPALMGWASLGVLWALASSWTDGRGEQRILPTLCVAAWIAGVSSPIAALIVTLWDRSGGSMLPYLVNLSTVPIAALLLWFAFLVDATV
jgi:hypothetical protein